MKQLHSPLISRYVIREILLALLAVVAVLLLVVVSNRLARYLAEAAAGNISSDVILSLLGLKLLGMLTLMMPLAAFIAVMLALGRLYRDSEMVALAACGVGGLGLYRPLLMFAIPLVMLVAVMALQVVPDSVAKANVLKERAKAEAELHSIIAGRFKESRNGQRIFFVERLSEDKQHVERIFSQVMDRGISKLQTAREALRYRDPQTNASYLVLRDGHLYEGEPGSANYRIVHFAEQMLRLPEEDGQPMVSKRDAMPTGELLASDDPRDVAEWQWRASQPVAALLLILLALPLAHASPRSGRFGKLGIGILIYIIYSNMLSAAQVWLIRGHTPEQLGLWWVHGLMVLVLAGFLYQRRGGRRVAGA